MITSLLLQKTTGIQTNDNNATYPAWVLQTTPLLVVFPVPHRPVCQHVQGKDKDPIYFSG